MYIVGIDLGTTNVKATVFDERLTAKSTQSQTVKYDRDGDFVEFDPCGYYDTVAALVDKSCAEAGLKKPYPITQIVLTGQAESLVSLKSDMSPARKGISWLDMRSREECEELKARFPAEVCYPVTGQPEIIPTWPITKILWIKKHEPGVFAAVSRYMLLKDYIAWRLSGRVAGEYSCYNFSHFFNIADKCYWDEIIDYVGIKRSQLSELVEPRTVIGTLCAAAQGETGACAEAKINMGALDHFCGMIGTGNIEDGMISESAGTVLSIATMVSNPDFHSPDRIPLHYGPFENKYVYLPVCESGGISMEWFKNTFCADESYKELDKKAAERDVSDSLLFLPYIAGTNAPEYNTYAKGVFYGITAAQDKYDFALAVMEGVAHLLRKNADLIAAGMSDSPIVSTGGGAKSALWTQLKADITGRRIAIPENEEACSLGAAMIAAVDEGVYGSFKAAADACVSIKKVYEPRRSELLERKHALFLKLYGAVEPCFRF